MTFSLTLCQFQNQHTNNHIKTYSSADGSTITVAGVVVARVELVAHKGGALPADVLDLGQLRVLNDAAGRIPRVRRENDASAAGDFLGDLLGVDVVAVFLGQGDGDGGELRAISIDFRLRGGECEAIRS
jgi:hypothetical protein